MQSRGIVLLHDETTTGTPDWAAGIWFGRFRKIPLFGILFKGHFAFRPDNRSRRRGKTLGYRAFHRAASMHEIMWPSQPRKKIQSAALMTK